MNYRRIAFHEPFSNIRITFDTNISASAEINRFLDGDYFRYPLLKSNEEILEVKFDEILPGHVRNIVNTGSLIPAAFSKYYLSRMKLNTLGVYSLCCII